MPPKIKKLKNQEMFDFGGIRVQLWNFQTLWCAIFGIVTKQSDKNWLDGVLKYTILGLLLAILAGAHLKWYLEPNSSIQELKKKWSIISFRSARVLN